MTAMKWREMQGRVEIGGVDGLNVLYSTILISVHVIRQAGS